MITPGLLRRALARAGQWRLIGLQLLLLALAGWVAVRPLAGFLQSQLGHLPGADRLMGALGSRALVDLLLKLSGPESWHPETASLSGLLLSLLFGALFAGAILAEAESDEPLRSRQLLAGAGTWYGRMFRTVFAGLIPYGLAAGLAAGALHWAGKIGERSTTELRANHAMHLALAVSALALFLAALWLDAARAWFVAQPSRRSAFFAVFAGGWLFLRRPLRVLAIGLGTLGLSLVLAAALVIARQHVVQKSAGLVLLALALSELALAALAWGRAARLIAFVELARADLLARSRLSRAAVFEMAPPRTSPPHLVPAAAMLAPAKLEPASAPPDLSPVPEAPRAPALKADAPFPTAPGAALLEIVAVQTISPPAASSEAAGAFAAGAGTGAGT